LTDGATTVSLVFQFNAEGAIAQGHPDMTPNIKPILLVDAGLLYLFAVFTTFPFWHQFAQWGQAGLRDRPAWQQNLIAIAP
jgi:hypothetical protein